MAISIPKYTAPDFSQDVLVNAPDVTWVPAPMDGAAPEGYHATSIFPEYFKVNGQWLLAEDIRMDCTAVLKNDKIEVLEFRNLSKGDLVALGREEDGSEGILVYSKGFASSQKKTNAFAFRKGRTREISFSKDYDDLYELLRYEKDHGYLVWVLGPAFTFDADARNAFSRLAAKGYVNALLAGNALATHDLEGALLRTALGQDIYTQEASSNGHYNHLDIINKAYTCGSIKGFIEKYDIQDGIMYECIRHNIPYVLVGSIRDDGPLPEVHRDAYAGQDAMREHLRKATTIIGIASTLHTIAAGNMTPTYRVVDGEVRPTYLYIVDTSEFAANKLCDRGSLTARAFITNAQDFIVNVSRALTK